MTVGPTQKFGRSFSVHDLVVVPEFFCKAGNFSFYRKLLQEMEKIERNHPGQFLEEKLYNNHIHCNNTFRNGQWKTQLAIFQKIAKRVHQYFDGKFTFNLRSARLLLYQNGDHWKPYHRDAAAYNKEVAKKQNVTVAVSLGEEREIAFSGSNQQFAEIGRLNGSNDQDLLMY